MSYFEGLIAAVPTAKKDVLRKQTAEAAPLFKQFGASRVVELLGDDIPRGATSFKDAIKARDNEEIMLSWIEYPDKQTRDLANKKMAADSKLRSIAETIAFDRSRAITAGFTPLIDEGSRGTMGYTEGYLVIVPEAKKQDYRAIASKTSKVFEEHGATRVVEAWGDDFSIGEGADFKHSVKAKPDETVVLAVVEWPSKQVRDRGMPKVMADSRLQAGQDNLPFDRSRMLHGGFKPVLDTAAAY